MTGTKSKQKHPTLLMSTFRTNNNLSLSKQMLITLQL